MFILSLCFFFFKYNTPVLYEIVLFQLDYITPKNCHLEKQNFKEKLKHS